MNREVPLVSIVCPAYNHAKFISKALDGFIMQKTNFPFEIIVHDDASTDNTVAIVKEYEVKYPQLFSNIYQKENQFSIAIGNVSTITYHAARGKYIALCEGDDYWTDPLKLQKQVNALESNSDCSFCFTNVLKLTQKTGELVSVAIPNVTNGRIIFKSYIERGGYIPTLTVMFKTSCLPNPLPAFFMNAIKQDWLTFLLLLKKGDGIYLDEVMGVYRYHDKSILMNTREVPLWKNNIYLVENTRAYFYPEYQEVLTNAVSWHLVELAFSYLDEYDFIGFCRNIFKAAATGDRKDLSWYRKNLARFVRWVWWRVKDLVKIFLKVFRGK